MAVIVAGVDPAIDEPGDPGDQGRGLATAGGSHAQDRPGRFCRGRALVRGQALEALEDGRGVRLRVGHGWIMTTRSCRRLTRCLAPFSHSVCGVANVGSLNGCGRV